MKIKIIAWLALILLSNSVLADVSARGYTRTDGTYVEPHYRSNPDGNINNNWSIKGNINPHTGREGTQNPQNDSDNL